MIASSLTAAVWCRLFRRRHFTPGWVSLPVEDRFVYCRGWSRTWVWQSSLSWPHPRRKRLIETMSKCQSLGWVIGIGRGDERPLRLITNCHHERSQGSALRGGKKADLSSGW